MAWGLLKGETLGHLSCRLLRGGLGKCPEHSEATDDQSVDAPVSNMAPVPYWFWGRGGHGEVGHDLPAGTLSPWSKSAQACQEGSAAEQAADTPRVLAIPSGLQLQVETGQGMSQRLAEPTEEGPHQRSPEEVGKEGYGCSPYPQ